jgi:hypothetical protein
MKNKFILITLIICIITLLTSCWTMVNLGKLRNDILRIDSKIEKVGFVPDSTLSDNKYISIDIIFYDGRRLYLELVNYGNRSTPNNPFYLARIGNYSFRLFSNHLDKNHEVELFVNERTGRKYYERTRERNSIPITIFADDMGIKFPDNKGNIKNLMILINNYDKVLSYVESLPEYNESFGDVFFDSLKMFTPKKIESTPSMYYIITRKDWNDNYWDERYSDRKKPDYEINESYPVFGRNLPIIHK